MSNRDYESLPFEEARAYVRALGLKSYEEWEKYRRSSDRPDNIPSNPERNVQRSMGKLW